MEAERLKSFTEHLIEFVVPSVDFLSYYRFKKTTICHHHQLPAEFEPRRGVYLQQIYSVWEDATSDTREFLAFALMYGDLKVENLSLANRLSGNLPGWATQFQFTYLDQLNSYLSNLVTGDIEIDTNPTTDFLPATADINLSSLVQNRKSLILMESTAILDALKSRLETFQNQSLPTIFDRLQHIGGGSSFSLEKLERAIVATARVHKLFREGQDFTLEEEVCQYVCPTKMLVRESTFIANLVEQNQLFDPLLVTPEYSPPRQNEMLQNTEPEGHVISSIIEQLVESAAAVSVEVLPIIFGAAEEAPLNTKVIKGGEDDDSLAPSSQSGRRKRKTASAPAYKKTRRILQATAQHKNPK